MAGADEQGSPYHDVLRDADDLGGMPVVVADLHSALPAVLAGLPADRRYAAPRRRSPTSCWTAARCRPGSPAPRRPCARSGWLAGTITTGQSFGGDLETVTLHSGLLAARHVLGAALAVVTQGPGNLGTGTRWGFSGVACGEAVNAAAVLGGRPVAVAAGQRRRPAGAAPRRLPSQPDRLRPGGPGPGRRRRPRPARRVRRRGGGRRRAAGRAAPAWSRSASTGWTQALPGLPGPRCPRMGRGLDEDLAYFLAAAAAGRHAAALPPRRRPPPGR